MSLFAIIAVLRSKFFMSKPSWIISKAIFLTTSTFKHRGEKKLITETHLQTLKRNSRLKHRGIHTHAHTHKIHRKTGVIQRNSVL